MKTNIIISIKDKKNIKAIKCKKRQIKLIINNDNYKENKSVANQISIKEKHQKLKFRKGLIINSNIIIYLYFLFFSIFFFAEGYTKNYSKYSYITLKINKTGIISFFNSFEPKNNLNDKNLYFPDEIYINDIFLNQNISKFYFETLENTITLKWKNEIKSTSYLFYNCSDIMEIDLSNFNSSLVTDMSYMFYGCRSLISLNLSNLNTSKVNNMEFMFYECSSLSLIDLSGFDTSNVLNFEYMFYNCSSLEVINFGNAIINSHSTKYNIFSLTPIKMIICSNNEKWKNLLGENSLTVNCSDNSKYGHSIEFYKNILNSYISKNFDQSKYCNLNNTKTYNDSSYNKCYIKFNSLNEYSNNIIDKNMDGSDKKFDYVKNIIQSLIKEFNNSHIDNGNDIEIKGNNMIITLTRTFNQKNNEDKNITVIDLKECEIKLKEIYNIPKYNALYIIKIEINLEGMKIPKIEYEIYYPLFNSDLIKLNLTYCKNENVELSIPVIINEDAEKYNPNDNYYNDICYKATSKFKTDINLIDRRNSFINMNMSLCEEDCTFIDYNTNIKKIKCSCPIKQYLTNIDEIALDRTKFFQNFKDLHIHTNLIVMKCYKNAFNKNSIKKNYGFFIGIFMIFLFFICLFIFIYKSFSNLKIDIKNYVFQLEIENKKHYKIKINKQLAFLGNIKSDKTNTLILENDYNNNYSNSFAKYKDFEMNYLEYKEAINYDERSFIQYYWSLLKNNHIIIFFFFGRDYNSTIIKIFLFFLSFSFHSNINTLFFNNDTLHQIYEDEGNYNFIYQIPPIIYSSIISYVAIKLIQFLSLSQKDILQIRNNKKQYLYKKYKLVKKVLTIKFFLFFIITFVLLIFFWFYITCFCGIFINTQIHLIINSALSFVLALFYPLIIYLIPGILRTISLTYEISCLYKLSSIIQMF